MQYIYITSIRKRLYNANPKMFIYTLKSWSACSIIIKNKYFFNPLVTCNTPVTRFSSNSEANT